MDRIENHPILGETPKRKKVTFSYDGKLLEGYEGEPIATALKAAGVMAHRYTAKTHEPRGVFCAIGRCTDCVMIVDGKPNIRTCITPLEAGMVKENCSKAFMTVTPGVRFADGDVGDQVRVTTPAKAKEIGSDYIIVGRPITASDDPVSAYRRCVKEFVG